MFDTNLVMRVGCVAMVGFVTTDLGNDTPNDFVIGVADHEGIISSVLVEAGEVTPRQGRSTSPVPPKAPRSLRIRGFGPVLVDAVDVYTIGGECTRFKTPNATTGELRSSIASQHSVLPEHVQLFSGNDEVTDATPVLSDHLTAVVRYGFRSVLFPTMS